MFDGCICALSLSQPAFTFSIIHVGILKNLTFFHPQASNPWLLHGCVSDLQRQHTSNPWLSMAFRLPRLNITHHTRTTKPLANKQSNHYKQLNKQANDTKRKVEIMKLMEVCIEAANKEGSVEALHFICDFIGINIEKLGDNAGVNMEEAISKSDEDSSWKDASKEERINGIFHMVSVLAQSLMPMQYLLKVAQEIIDSEGDAKTSGTNNIE